MITCSGIFLKIKISRPKLPKPRRYLYLHLWYQHLRKANRETELPEESELPLVPSAEEETMDRSGQLDLLRRVHQLPEPGREVVYLRAFGGLSFREIGDVLGKTETWARVTFYRGKERLKQGGDSDEK